MGCCFSRKMISFSEFHIQWIILLLCKFLSGFQVKDIGIFQDYKIFVGGKKTIQKIALFLQFSCYEKYHKISENCSQASNILVYRNRYSQAFLPITQTSFHQYLCRGTVRPLPIRWCSWGASPASPLSFFLCPTAQWLHCYSCHYRGLWPLTLLISISTQKYILLHKNKVNQN